MDTMHDRYISRCFELARNAQFSTGTNPTVGAVLVHEGKIIGEGWYSHFGASHAEVMAIKSVSTANRPLISESILYVSLEPCCIHGKTPPCTDAILNNDIKTVVISCLDPNEKMNGKSVALLESKGIKVIKHILHEEGLDLIRPFKAALRKRPFVILKFAQSSDAYFGKRNKQVWISNKESQMKVHMWRAQCDGILIGRSTAEIDNPQLNVRLVPGEDPLRIVLDSQLQLNRDLHIWADNLPTLFVSSKEAGTAIPSNKSVLIIENQGNYLDTLLARLFEQGIHTLLVEGGAATIKSFISEQLWDEARVITSNKKMVSGIRAPLVTGRVYKKEKLGNDSISYVYPE